MGLNRTARKVLQRMVETQPLGNVLTLGRQRIYFNSTRYEYREYCERYLLDMGARSVDSVDISDYEGCTYVADLNSDVVGEGILNAGHYDTVLDLGTTEHIFDLQSVNRNIKNLLALGGRVLHVLPANNFCGHGFYQFSPEYFNAIYAERNGYKLDLLAVSCVNSERLFAVDIRDGKRCNLRSIRGLSVIAVGKNESKDLVSSAVQSDYAYLHSDDGSSSSNGCTKRFVKKILKKSNRASAVVFRIYDLWSVFCMYFFKLNNHLKRIR